MKDKFRVWFKSLNQYLDRTMIIDSDGGIGELNEWGDIVPTYNESLLKIEKSIPTTDINDNQAFVGDILDVRWDLSNYVIKWDNDRLGFKICDIYGNCHSLTKKILNESIIIGNINENPKLMEEL